LLTAFQLRYADRIVPGVQALGVDLSGMTLDEAAAALENRFEYGQQAIFTFRDGDRFWQMSAADLGVGFDARETAAAAFSYGHSGSILRDLLGQSQAWLEGRQVSSVITWDQNAAVAQLQAIAENVNRDPVNAALMLDGTSVRVTEASSGRRLDVAATLERLSQHINRMDQGAEIALIIHETAPLVGSVAEAAARLQTALSGALTLVATDQNGAQLGPWTVSVEQIASLLQVALVNNGDGTQQYVADINMAAFEGFLQQLAPGLITPALDGRFDFDPATGQLGVIRPAQSGRILNVAETLMRLEQGVFTDNRIVPMAFDYTLPRYHNQITAAELGILELVAEATTYYEGSSQNRRTNIAVGVSRIDGVIVAPGEEFSFNYHIGEITEANGYVEGLLIYGGRTIAGLGGGICQVSTNLFRAAFQGGFAITERNSHGYRVGYYELRGQPAGFDAAIWQPERDFRFQNNTPYHILIEATLYPGDNALQVRIYSTKHWQVDLEDPIMRDQVPAPPPKYEANNDLLPGQILQVDFAAEGADVTIYRNVYDLAGNLAIRDYAYTHYVPWQAIYQVAPGDSRLSANQG
jgi:vancomycin resistance protein YoaR